MDISPTNTMKMITPHSLSVGTAVTVEPGVTVTTAFSFRALQVFVTGELLASPL